MNREAAPETPEDLYELEKKVLGADIGPLHYFNFYPDTQRQAHQIANAATIGREADAYIGGPFLDGSEQFFNVKCTVRITSSTWMKVHLAMYKIAKDASSNPPDCTQDRQKAGLPPLSAG